ncbi:MAG TPA: protein kinase [Candidatus Dormibacteraeota bacterium]|nr:protein kinase [Candidatus Dormibacteraeota bacterium]
MQGNISPVRQIDDRSTSLRKGLSKPFQRLPESPKAVLRLKGAVAEWHLGPGTVIDRFEVNEYLRPAPAGGEYEGYDRTLHHFVTIAVLRSLSNDRDRERFESAAPGVAAFRHASLAPVAAFGQSEEIPYVVYDCESRSSLDDAVRGRGMPDELALRLLAKVADGVDAAHEKGFVHGDLSPSTIVLDPRGEPLIVGLGLAPLMPRQTDGAPFVPDPTSSAFIAPEESERGEITPASDRYSFAATAYEVLTGTKPSAAPAVNLGPATTRVFRTGLAPAGEARWPSCTAMVDALAAARREDVGFSHHRPSAVAGWLIAAVAILAVAVGVLLWATSRPASPAPAISVSDSTIEQGGSLLVSASGLPANQVGTIELESSPVQIGAFEADQNGNANVRVTIPTDASPGGHVVSLCWDNTCHASAKVTVTERATSPTPSTSPSPSPSPTPSPSPSPSPSATATRTTPSPSASPSAAAASPS